MLIFTKTKQMKTVTLEEIKDNVAIDHLINKIFDDLEKNAMPFDNHVYDVKAANQIIRNHLTNLKQDNWINVKERLPEHLENVLMYGHIKEYDNANMEMYSGIINKAGGLNEWHSLGKIIIVSHWQPLPNPPINSNQ